jgi:hypothetical protein
MTEEAERLKVRLSRYEDPEITHELYNNGFQNRRKRAHCFITEPAVF